MTEGVAAVLGVAVATILYAALMSRLFLRPVPQEDRLRNLADECDEG